MDQVQVILGVTLYDITQLHNFSLKRVINQLLDYIFFFFIRNRNILNLEKHIKNYIEIRKRKKKKSL